MAEAALRKPSRYKQALKKMAEDVRDQIALEKHQTQTRISTEVIDRVRANSYQRLALELERSLGIDLGARDHHF